MHYVCALYAKPAYQSLNKICCEWSHLGITPKKLPPTENSFELHLLSCAYQLSIWRSAATGPHNPPNPTDYGWEHNPATQMLQPMMMSQPCAPPELLNDLVCDCNICGEDCCCHLNGQICTDDCKCKAALPGTVTDHEEEVEQYCMNPKTLEAAFPSTSDLEDSSDESDSDKDFESD